MGGRRDLGSIGFADAQWEMSDDDIVAELLRGYMGRPGSDRPAASAAGFAKELPSTAPAEEALRSRPGFQLSGADPAFLSGGWRDAEPNSDTETDVTIERVSFDSSSGLVVAAEPSAEVAPGEGRHTGAQQPAAQGYQISSEPGTTAAPVVQSSNPLACSSLQLQQVFSPEEQWETEHLDLGSLLESLHADRRQSYLAPDMGVRVPDQATRNEPWYAWSQPQASARAAAEAADGGQLRTCSDDEDYVVYFLANETGVALRCCISGGALHCSSIDSADDAQVFDDELLGGGSSPNSSRLSSPRAAPAVGVQSTPSSRTDPVRCFLQASIQQHVSMEVSCAKDIARLQQNSINLEVEGSLPRVGREQSRNYDVQGSSRGIPLLW